ncbi:hypothetical protein [Chryseobacterium sp.]|uniref:hypothetical protein n=1 Tax=Chryseobacterium sp. TaxID=1871047 RepID=UPI00289686C9|nr:hypothetical protein [Chryseobacterium sp.]
MAKKGVYKISGNVKPVVGKKEFYTVDEWYSSTPLADRNLAKVTWELFIKTDSGFRTTNIKKKGINHFTFGKNAHQHLYKIEGYLHEPEGNSPMSLIVQPQKSDDKKSAVKKDIKNVVLTYENDSKINKTLSYRDRLKATATCEGLEGENIVFKLWEDDEAGNGHHHKNQYITKSPPIQVNKYGKAKWNFSLSPTFITLANKREDDKSKHEYYVTAEFNGKILEDSQNVNVINPEYKTEKPKTTPKKPSLPQPQPKKETPKFPTKATSPKKQNDPKGKILNAEFVDRNGKKINSAKIGNTVSIKIISQNMKDKVVTVKIWEDDTFNDDLLFEKKIRITNDEAYINNVTLTKEMYEKGQKWEAEGNTQEFFIEIEHLSVSTESVRIDVGMNEEPKKIENGKSTGVVKKTTVESKTDKECCIIDEVFFLTNYEKEFPTFNKQRKLIPLSNLVKVSLRRMFKSISEYYSNEKRCCNKYHIAYMLATAKHETGNTFDPVEEANWLSWNARKKYFEEMYDVVLGKNEKRRKMANDNGNTKEGDGAKYYGRGYVQLTWKNNYQKMQDKFGVNLVDNRSNALNHELAVKIMIYGSEKGIFTGVKLSNYISESKKDYVNARRVINGTDQATSIAGYAEKIEKCLKIKKCNCGESQKTSPETSSSSEKIVSFDSGLTEERVKVVSQFTISLLEKAAKSSANDKLIITSTIRSTRKQAEVMYSNENSGNHIRYAAPGRAVITVFNAGKNRGDSKEKIISDMDKKIKELSENGQRVSLHCVSKEAYSKNNIIDISYSRGAKNPRDLIRELVKDPAVTKIIHPLNNVVSNNKIRYDAKEPAIHVEIKIS